MANELLTIKRNIKMVKVKNVTKEVIDPARYRDNQVYFAPGEEINLLKADAELIAEKNEGIEIVAKKEKKEEKKPKRVSKRRKKK